MSTLLKLVCETSVIRQRYAEIHQKLFRVSLGRLVRLRSRSARPDYGARAEELERLERDLQRLRNQLAQLTEGQLTQRSGRELRAALRDYTVALEDSIRKLRVISERSLKEQQGIAEYQTYSLGDYRLDRIAYDDALQHHKRLGIRLNQLLSSF